MLNADATTTTRLMDAAGASAYGFACARLEGAALFRASAHGRQCATLFTEGYRTGFKGRSMGQLVDAWPPARFAYEQGYERGADAYAEADAVAV